MLHFHFPSCIDNVAVVVQVVPIVAVPLCLRVSPIYLESFAVQQRIFTSPGYINSYHKQLKYTRRKKQNLKKNKLRLFKKSNLNNKHSQ